MGSLAAVKWKGAFSGRLTYLDHRLEAGATHEMPLGESTPVGLSDHRRVAHGFSRGGVESTTDSIAPSLNR